MTRLEEYQARLTKCRSEFVAVCVQVASSPVRSGFDYAGLYYQYDDQSLIPISLVWITHPGGQNIDSGFPFKALRSLEWQWTDSDVDEGVHEEGEEILFEWISKCWIEAGGESFKPLFVLYDHGSMDIYDLRTLDLMSDEDIDNILA